MSPCPACGAALVTGLQPWHRTCPACSYEGSVLEPHILEQAPGGDLDEQAREVALAGLRQDNFARMHDWLRRLGVTGSRDGRRPRLLDVGCAHGWFLQECAGDFDGIGIEPDAAVAAATTARGLPVRPGFFPDVLDASERFDLIVFNDVLEHIPDVRATLAACRQHLDPGGLLVVNAPSRSGAIYRLSRLLVRLGRPASFARMWQEGFPSPHVHYFDDRSLPALAAAQGFTRVARRRLPAVSVSGLYSRIRYSRDVSAIKAGLLTLAVAAAMPVLALLPADIEVWAFRAGDAR